MEAYEIDYKKLKISLKRVEENRAKPKYKDPCRGLKGELQRKMLAGLSGHRSGVMTKAEEAEVKRIQEEYDTKYD